MNSILVEFEDGYKVVTSRYAVRRSSKGLQAAGATGWRKMDDGSMGDFDWSDITQEPPRR